MDVTIDSEQAATPSIKGDKKREAPSPLDAQGDIQKKTRHGPVSVGMSLIKLQSPLMLETRIAIFTFCHTLLIQRTFLRSQAS